MKGVGTDIGTIHFVGIGGIGMSGIAEVMHNLGYKVQGSRHRRRLCRRGAAQARHPGRRSATSADNLGDAAVVVCSTAIKRRTIPRSQAADERRLPRGPPRRDAGRADAAASRPSRSPAPTARPRRPR